MKNYIEFLEKTNVYSLENKIGTITFYKLKSTFRISFVLECKTNHLQPLKELGLKIDFSNKRVNMAYNQNSLSGTGNNVSVMASCDLKIFKKICVYFRKDFHSNLANDCQLESINFPFTPKKIKTSTHVILKNQKHNELICKIRRNVHKRKYSHDVYNMPIVQKAINRF